MRKAILKSVIFSIIAGTITSFIWIFGLLIMILVSDNYTNGGNDFLAFLITCIYPLLVMFVLLFINLFRSTSTLFVNKKLKISWSNILLVIAVISEIVDLFAVVLIFSQNIYILDNFFFVTHLFITALLFIPLCYLLVYRKISIFLKL